MSSPWTKEEVDQLMEDMVYPLKEQRQRGAVLLDIMYSSENEKKTADMDWVRGHVSAMRKWSNLRIDMANTYLQTAADMFQWLKEREYEQRAEASRAEAHPPEVEDGEA